jgi:hypothetical protein
MSNTTHRCSRLLAVLAALALASGCQVALSSLSKRTGWGTESSEQSAPPDTATPVARSEPTSTPAPQAEPHRTELPEPEHVEAPDPEPERTAQRTPERPAAPTTMSSTRPAPPAPQQPSRIFLNVGERAPAGAMASCRAPGRGEMCDGVCTDVQVNDDHCGMCGNDCNPGSHCDFSTCRNAEGKPE